MHKNHFTEHLKPATRNEQRVTLAHCLQLLSKALAAAANNPADHALDAIDETIAAAADALRQLRGTAHHHRDGWHARVQRLRVLAKRWLLTVRRSVKRRPTKSTGVANHIHLVRLSQQAEPTRVQLRFVGDLGIACKHVITNPTPDVFAAFRGVIAGAATTLDELRQEPKR